MPGVQSVHWRVREHVSHAHRCNTAHLQSDSPPPTTLPHTPCSLDNRQEIPLTFRFRFIGLKRTQALKNCNITHIVSAIDWEFKDDSPTVRGYRHLHIPVDDVDDENLLEWFPKSNQFIHQGLHYRPSKQDTLTDGIQHDDQKGSGVYIHW